MYANASSALPRFIWSSIRRRFTPQVRLSRQCEVVVFVKDPKHLSYRTEQISEWGAELFWEDHRMFGMSWSNCIGFRLWCPPSLGFSGVTAIRDIIRWVAQRPVDVLGHHKHMFYRLAKSLTVDLSS